MRDTFVTEIYIIITMKKHLISQKMVSVLWKSLTDLQNSVKIKAETWLYAITITSFSHFIHSCMYKFVVKYYLNQKTQFFLGKADLQLS